MSGRRLQSVVSNDVGVAVVMDDHVHLRRAGDLLVDLDAVEIVLSEVVPVPVMLAPSGGPICFG